MITILVSLLIQSTAAAEEIKSFESDLCTLFPNGKWGHCCFEHDLHYWAGGLKSRRSWADLELKRCVARTGKVFVSKLIYNGVRMGHLSPFKLKDRKWGNAYGGRKSFKAHSEAEFYEIAEELQHYDFSDELKDKLLDSL